MGYNTDFTGVLKFKNEATGPMLAELSKFMGEDCRRHPEWDAIGLTWINLKLADDFSGVEWDEGEKPYDMLQKLQMISWHMISRFPEFCFTGDMNAQGEDIDDRYTIRANDDGTFVKIDVPVVGDRIECPECCHVFILEDKSD